MLDDLRSTCASCDFLCVFIFRFPGDYVKLKIHTPMYTIAKALASPNSGLEVKDRVWLKITIPKSFIGKHLIIYCRNDLEGALS